MEAPDPNAVEPTRTPSNRGSSADGEKNPYAYGSDKWHDWKLKRNGGKLRAGMSFNESNKRVAEDVRPVLEVTGDLCLSAATGPYRDIIEIGTGKDMWDERELSGTERTVKAALTFGIPLVGAVVGNFIEYGSKLARGVNRASRAGEQVEEVLQSGLRVGSNVRKNGEFIDFASSASRIPGAVWSNMSQLRSYLSRQGIGLIENGSWYLDKFGSNKMAGFDWSRSRPVIFLRPGATRVEVLHEIGHGLAYNRLGEPFYESLDDPIREAIASAFVTGRSSFTQKMTFEQLFHELENLDAVIPADVLDQLRGIL
jgi:hypothetical protein